MIYNECKQTSKREVPQSTDYTISWLWPLLTAFRFFSFFQVLWLQQCLHQQCLVYQVPKALLLINARLKIVVLDPNLKLLIPSTCYRKIICWFCLWDTPEQLEYGVCSIRNFSFIKFQMSFILNARLKMVILGPILKLLIPSTCYRKIIRTLVFSLGHTGAIETRSMFIQQFFVYQVPNELHPYARLKMVVLDPNLKLLTSTKYSMNIFVMFCW